GHGGDAFALVELGVKVGKALAVGAALERVGPGLERPAFEAAEALERVLRPADRLAKLAVADHVHPDLGLLSHDLGHRRRQADRISRLVERFSHLPGAQKILQRRRTDETADMGGEDAFAAAFHAWSWRAAPGST